MEKQSGCQSSPLTRADWKLLAEREIGRFTTARARTTGALNVKVLALRLHRLDEPAAAVSEGRQRRSHSGSAARYAGPNFPCNRRILSGAKIAIAGWGHSPSSPLQIGSSMERPLD